MSKLIAAARKFIAGGGGATMVEYGLMLALIALVCIVAVTTLGNNTSSVFSTLSGSV